MDRNEILSAIFSAVDEVNGQLEEGKQLAKTPEAALGSGSGLDSLGLVSLLAAVEESVADRFGREVSILNEKTLGRLTDGNDTLGGLADTIEELLAEA